MTVRNRPFGAPLILTKNKFSKEHLQQIDENHGIISYK